MKSNFFSSLVGLLLAAATMVGCSGDSNDLEPQPQSSIPTSQKPVYFSPTLEQSDLLTALQKTFPNRTTLDAAQIAFFGKSAGPSDYADFYAKGGFVMLCGADDNTEKTLCASLSEMPSIPDYDNDLSDEDRENLMLFGFNNSCDEFWMPWPYEPKMPDLSKLQETVDMGSEETDPNDPDDPERTVEESDYSLPKYDADYLMKHFGELVAWADKGEILNTRSNIMMKSDAGEVLDMSHLGQRHHFVYPIGIDALVDKGTGSKADWLKKQSEIVGDIEITPLYASGANLPSDAGDYYVVLMDLIVKSGPMWGPQQFKHGGCNDRVIGLYLENLILKAAITGSDDKALPGVLFKPVDGYPEPGSNNGSSDFSESRTLGFNVGASVGFEDKKLMGNVSASFNASWSRSISRSIKDLQVKLDTPGDSVKYVLEVGNIVNKRSWDNVGKNITKYYPEICRSDMRFTCCWVWFLPSSTNSSAGVKDGSSTQFKLSLYMCPTYGTYNWWRGASWDKEKHFTPNKSVVATIGGNSKTIKDGIFLGDIDMPAPNRTRFGYISLENKSSMYTLANVRIRQTGSTEYQNIAGAVNQDKSIEMTVEEGTYDVEFSFLDPNTNTVIDRYGISSVTVKQGRSKEDSTTKIASTQGQRE